MTIPKMIIVSRIVFTYWWQSKYIEANEYRARLKSKTEKDNRWHYSGNIHIPRIQLLRWDTLNLQVSVGPYPLGSYDKEVQCDKEYLMAQIDYLDKEIRSWME